MLPYAPMTPHPDCADNVLLENGRGDQFCVKKQPTSMKRLRCSKCECGVIKHGFQDPERIAGGREAIPHTYPWQVWLFQRIKGLAQKFEENFKTEFQTKGEMQMYQQFYDAISQWQQRGGDQSQCGGTILSEKHVIMAAHCVKKTFNKDYRKSFRINITVDIEPIIGNREFDYFITPGDVSLIAGAHDVRPNFVNRGIGMAVPILNIKPHENYVSYVYTSTEFIPTEYDYAIITLAIFLPFTSTLSPACLPVTETDMYAGRVVTTSGYGYKNPQEGWSPQLRETKMQVLTNQHCTKTYREYLDPVIFQQDLSRYIHNY